MNRLGAAVRCTLLVACGATSTLAAQSASERSALQLFRDSLQIVRDTATLHALEAATIVVARTHRDDPLVHLRLGFVALRINELGGSVERVDDAAGEFEWAAEVRPEWPYPWFGLGLAEARAADRAAGFAGGLWTMLGLDRDTRAGAAFARAIKADPGFVEGLVEFAETARTQRIGAPVAAALEALRLAQASPLGWDPQLLLERGRLERLAGSPDSARVAFRRAMLLGSRPAMVSLELARTLPLTADTVPSGRDQPLPVEIAYYGGAGADDPEVVAMYRRDLEPIADDTTLAQFDRVGGEGRVAWLREFWQQRAATDMRSPGARLSEHYRRWDHAIRHFRLPPFRRVYRWGIETYRSHDADLDDRGIVWLRQGAPTAQIVWPQSEPRVRGPVSPGPLIRLAPVPGSLFINPPVGENPTFGNETWRYARPDGDLVLNFTAAEDPDDYRLVESVLQLDVGFDALLDHAGELPGLSALLRSGPSTRVGLAEEDRLKGKRSIGLATTTSSWARSYAITMGGRVQWLVAGVRAGRPLVHIVYAVDAAMLRLLPVDRRTGLIPITLRAVFLDGHGNPVAALDTVQFMHRPGADAGMIAARAEIPVPPGTLQMRLNVEANRAIGTLYPIDTLGVPDPKGGLALSSVLIGAAGRSLPWVAAPGDTVWLAPERTFASSDTLSLFVEAYGVRPGRSYAVRVSLTRQRSALARLLKPHRESVTFADQVAFPADTGEIRRTVALGGLDPGNYLLEVMVTGEAKPVVRRRLLVVAGKP